ncbi:MAG: BrnT family toxin [Oscillospiraceae bacterium]|nr:BrnT family toxin [Oscillospiraceae bacterium]
MEIFLDMLFDWDEDKARVNEHKHGISFTEAMTAFGDANAVLLDDKAHSDEEDRFILLGMSKETSLLVVCHCYRDEYDAIRLISARKANKSEEKIYGGTGK